MEDQPASRFGRFVLQPGQRRLLQDDEPVALGARAFDLLLALVAQRDRIVTKNELMDQVWPGLVVQENNLQVQIGTLRKVLGPQAIATVPGRGYRFTAVLDAPASVASSLHAGAAAPAVAPTSRRTNLPVRLEPLLGREADLAALRELVESNALVTVLGAGGIGKSRLAQAAAHAGTDRWADGAWMVELAGLSDPALVPHAVAQVLDVPVSTQAPALDTLVAALAPRSLLLVLDNCEHLLDAVGALAHAIGRHAPRVTVLVTSQEPLRLPAERRLRVGPLDVPANAGASGARSSGAVSLFAARARAVDPRFELTDASLALTIDICRHLDGLPLAIELAAARVSALGLQPLHDKLDARFRLLTGGSRVTLLRHQTLRAALEWSCSLLDDDERCVFRRLGVFAGGFTIDLAQALAADERLDAWAVLDHLASLVDKSLVVADPGETPRYRLLESARAYALDQLGVDELAQARRRHAQAMRAFCERIDGPHLDGETRTEDLGAALLPEMDNVRAAHAWAAGEGRDAETAFVLAACASALEEFALEATCWLLALRPAVQDDTANPAARARAWRAIASINMTLSGGATRAEQEDAATQAAALYRALQLPRREFSSLTLHAVHVLAQGDRAGALAVARRSAEAARALARPDWPAMLWVRLLRLDANLARRAGAFDDALVLMRQLLRVSVSTGDWLVEEMARHALADLLWQMGHLDEAAGEARFLVAALRQRPVESQDTADTFSFAAAVLAEAGCLDEALVAARASMALQPRAQRLCPPYWTWLFHRLGHAELAARWLGASEAWLASGDESWGPNPARLVAAVRAALPTRLAAPALAQAVAFGAGLGSGDLLALIRESLDAAAERPGSRPG